MAKSISKELTDKQTAFLAQNIHLKERVVAGIDVFPSDSEITQLQEIARIFDTKSDLHVKGCQDCVNKLVKFVYEKTA
jgi:hypothetical protein